MVADGRYNPSFKQRTPELAGEMASSKSLAQSKPPHQERTLSKRPLLDLTAAGDEESVANVLSTAVSTDL